MVGKHEDWDGAGSRRSAPWRAGSTYLNADWAAAVKVVTDGEAPVARTARGRRWSASTRPGLPLKSVARRLGVAEETAKEYLARVKRKYLDGRSPRAYPHRAVPSGRVEDGI